MTWFKKAIKQQSASQSILEINKNRIRYALIPQVFNMEASVDRKAKNLILELLVQVRKRGEFQERLKNFYSDIVNIQRRMRA